MITHSRNAKIHLNPWSAGPFDSAFRAIRCQLRTAGAPVLRCAQQSPAHHIQIHQPTGDKQSRRVLVQATVAHLAESKDALEYQKRVLDFGPHFRLRFVFRLVSIAQRAIAAAFLVGKVFRVGCPFSNRIALPGIGRIAPDASFVTMQQVFEHGVDLYLCERASGKSLASAILELKNDPELRKRLAINGYNLYQEQFNLQHNGERYLQHLEHISR